MPRVLGVPLGRARLGLLGLAAVLAAAAACAVGALGFVGLVAPHAARALVGARHSRSIPVAMLLGALLVSIADTLGRTVLTPTQLAAGLVTALIGAPRGAASTSATESDNLLGETGTTASRRFRPGSRP